MLGFFTMTLPFGLISSVFLPNDSSAFGLALVAYGSRLPSTIQLGFWPCYSATFGGLSFSVFLRSGFRWPKTLGFPSAFFDDLSFPPQ